MGAGRGAGYTGTARDTLQELVARTGELYSKTLSRDNTHLICLTHRSRAPARLGNEFQRSRTPQRRQSGNLPARFKGLISLEIWLLKLEM
jgi:hypothetical protein